MYRFCRNARVDHLLVFRNSLRTGALRLSEKYNTSARNAQILDLATSMKEILHFNTLVLVLCRFLAMLHQPGSKDLKYSQGAWAWPVKIFIFSPLFEH